VPLQCDFSANNIVVAIASNSILKRWPRQEWSASWLLASLIKLLYQIQNAFMFPISIKKSIYVGWVERSEAQHCVD
jgi:hypothetical protein